MKHYIINQTVFLLFFFFFDALTSNLPFNFKMLFEVKINKLIKNGEKKLFIFNEGSFG